MAKKATKDNETAEVVSKHFEEPPQPSDSVRVRMVMTTVSFDMPKADLAHLLEEFKPHNGQPKALSLPKPDETAAPEAAVA